MKNTTNLKFKDTDQVKMLNMQSESIKLVTERSSDGHFWPQKARKA